MKHLKLDKLKKISGILAVVFGVIASQSAVAASTSVYVEIRRSTLSRAVELIPGGTNVEFTYVANIIQVGSTSAQNRYVQMRNSGGIDASINLIDNCLINAKSDVVAIRLTMDSSGADARSSANTYIDLAKKPTSIVCWEVVPN